MFNRRHILFRMTVAASVSALVMLASAPAWAQTVVLSSNGTLLDRYERYDADGRLDRTPITSPTLLPIPSATPTGPWGISSAMCSLDRDGDGYVDQPNERGDCYSSAEGPELCPLDAVSCTPGGPTGWTCPTDPAAGCLTTDISQITPKCSPVACAVPTGPAEVVPDRPAELFQDDGATDADGNCLSAVMIFSGRALDCRPPGIATTFMNCCKNRGKIINDTKGQSFVSTAAAGVALAATFTGMKAAYTAFKAGAGASSAASQGLNAMIVGIDPATIALSIAFTMIVDLLLTGCNAEDMEAGVLRGSDMCVDVGSYCKIKIPLIGCVQKAKSNCCFNSKLGRIIQEQGRPQLASFSGGWGTAKIPDCRGFSPEEFQALDFSKMDLSEYYADIETEAQSVMTVKVQEAFESYLHEVGGGT